MATTVVAQGFEVKIAIAAKATTDFARAGISTSRKYEFALAVPGRKTTRWTIFHRNEENSLLTKQEMTLRLPNLAMGVSPDKRHFALLLPPYAKQAHFFHLLPKGQPLHLKAFDDQAKVDTLEKIDWSKVPAPEELARDAVLAAAAEVDEVGNICLTHAPLYIPSNLGEVVKANLDQALINEALIQAWPSCRDVGDFIGDLVRSKAGPPDLSKRLKSKMAQILAAEERPARELVAIFKACLVLDDQALLNQVTRRAVERWPEDTGVYEIFAGRVDRLPPDIKKELLSRASAALESDDEGHRLLSNHIIEEARAGN